MGLTRRQTSEASSTASTAPPATPLALPHCGSLATMDVPWSPAMSRAGVRVDDDDDDFLGFQEIEDTEDDTVADDDRDHDQELGEFVCYGDRICLLCDGQLLALTRKFNLSYQQMALLATATIVSGGLLGVASLLIWKKGLLRKRYAALLSDLIYANTNSSTHSNSNSDANEQLQNENTNTSAKEHSMLDQNQTAPTTTLKKDKARAVTFRIFEYDPENHSIQYRSLGQPVQFGAPIIVAHAASRRAIRYKPHHGAVTISRPPRNAHFRKDIKETLAHIDASLQAKADQNASSHKQPHTGNQHKTRPKSLTTTLFQRVLGGDRVAAAASDKDQYKRKTLTTAAPPPPAALGKLRSTVWSDPTPSNNEVLLRRRASQPPQFRDVATPPQPARKKNLMRSISASCLSLVRNLNDSVHHEKDHHALHKQKRLLLKDLPNMAFPERDGKYFVARLQAPVTPLFRSASMDHPIVPPVEPPMLLRWGAPMQLVADYNGSPCGFHSREYYRDAQQYMSTEGTQCSPATMIPIPESGNLQAIAKESVRRVAHLEKRQVTLRVGTYNVWMMPRKISMFASVSPKKNTRAKLIADVLPPCDLWVFTECFDHRARSVLLDKLKQSGAYYFNSPTVGHKRRGPDGRYLDKLLNGGVVLASKYPILSVKIKLFREASAGSDRFADKGVLYCKILKDGLLVHVFSTHLQAWNDPLSRAARRQQLAIIAELMESMGIDETVDCVLYVGDLNVNKWLNKENGEYDEMLALLDARDSGSPPNPINATAKRDFKRQQQFSFDGRLNPLACDGPSSDGSLELLDYVLFSKSHRQPSQSVSYVQPIFATTPWVWKKQPQFHLSDHFPVISELTFDMWKA